MDISVPLLDIAATSGPWHWLTQRRNLWHWFKFFLALSDISGIEMQWSLQSLACLHGMNTCTCQWGEYLACCGSRHSVCLAVGNTTRKKLNKVEFIGIEKRIHRVWNNKILSIFVGTAQHWELTRDKVRSEFRTDVESWRWGSHGNPGYLIRDVLRCVGKTHWCSAHKSGRVHVRLPDWAVKPRYPLQCEAGNPNEYCFGYFTLDLLHLCSGSHLISRIWRGWGELFHVGCEAHADGAFHTWTLQLLEIIRQLHSSSSGSALRHWRFRSARQVAGCAQEERFRCATGNSRRRWKVNVVQCVVTSHKNSFCCETANFCELPGQFSSKRDFILIGITQSRWPRTQLRRETIRERFVIWFIGGHCCETSSICRRWKEQSSLLNI